MDRIDDFIHVEGWASMRPDDRSSCSHTTVTCCGQSATSQPSTTQTGSRASSSPSSKTPKTFPSVSSPHPAALRILRARNQTGSPYSLYAASTPPPHPRAAHQDLFRANTIFNRILSLFLRQIGTPYLLDSLSVPPSLNIANAEGPRRCDLRRAGCPGGTPPPFSPSFFAINSSSLPVSCLF